MFDATEPQWSALQQAIDALPFYVLVIDAEHRILAVNRAICDALHIEARQVLGQACPGVVHGVEGPFPGCPLEEAVTSGTAAEKELYDDKTGMWFRSSIFPTELRTRDGRRLYLHFARDISASKQAQEDLSRSLEHHRALKEILERVQSCQTTDQILEVLIDQILCLSWMSLTGSAVGFIKRGSTLEMRVRHNIHPALEESCSEVALDTCLCGLAARTGEMVVKSHVDSDHQTSSEGMADHGHVVVPLVYEQGVLAVVTFYLPAGSRPDGVQTHFLESAASVAATAVNRLQMQAQLLEAQYQQLQTQRIAALGSLVAGVAHEVNNPLAGLKNCQQRLMRHDLPLDRKQEYLELMAAGLDRIGRVVTQLLDFARMRAPNRSHESLARLVETVCELLRPQMEARAARVEVDLGALEGLRTLMDPRQIEQALTNLLLNALWVTPHGGAIRVCLLRSAERIGVKIVDDGPGVPEADRDKIEHPFFTTKPEGEGTGLGLSVTRTIVDAHQGDLVFVFPREGGTVVTLWLPLVEEL